MIANFILEGSFVN